MNSEQYQWQEKVWGRTKRLHVPTPLMTKHILMTKVDTFCSYHFHYDRMNIFHVVSGKIRIIETCGTAHIGIDLNEGDTHIVRARVSHQFQVLKPSIVVEDYLCDAGSPQVDDIHRHWCGGIATIDIASNPSCLYVPSGCPYRDDSDSSGAMG